MLRGPYARDHIQQVKRGSSVYFRFKLAVPEQYRELVGKDAWITHIKGATTRRQAADIAAREDIEGKALRELDSLRRLTPDQTREIEAAGGLDSWRKRMDELREADDLQRPFLELAASGLAPSAYDDVFEMYGAGAILDQNAVARANAERELVKLETRHKRVAAIEERLSGGEKKRPKLMALVDHWATQVRPARKTLGKYVLYFERLADSIGRDIEPKQVTRAHIIKYRDAVFANPQYGKSVDKHIDAVKAVFGRALSDELVAINPADGIKLPEIRRAKKQGFTVDQAKAIFAALPDYAPPLMDGLDFQWMMKLLAYQGARSGEIAQLRCCDVMSVDGILAIDIDELEESGASIKTIKNDASVRRIPVHPVICAEFRAFVDGVSASHGANAWLFQSLSETRKNGRVDVFERAANEGLFLNTLNITDKRYRLHSWRHRFRSLCRIAKVPKTHSTALMGHTEGGGAHGAYGERPPLAELLGELRKIDPAQDRANALHAEA